MSSLAPDYANQKEAQINAAAARIFISRIDDQLARWSFIHFCRVVFGEGWQEAPHHLLIADYLMQVFRGEVDRLDVSMPPRHGKSEMISILFAAFWLAHNPGKQIIHISYAAALSNEFSRKVRAIIRDNMSYRKLFPHMRLDPDRARLDDWKLAGGGGFKSVGVGGGVTGHGADLIIVDDPLKEGDEQSPTILSQIFTWFLSAARTRLHPGGAIIMVMTRWHPLDLIGRLKDLAKKDPDSDQWTSLVLPALAEENDPLGRAPGAALWPARYARKALLAIKALSERYFEALFQQNPKISETPLFEAGDFRRMSQASASRIGRQPGVWCFDLATALTERADYTVATRWHMSRSRQRLYCSQVVRFRAEWPGVKAWMKQLVETYTDDDFAFPKHVLELLAVQELKTAYSGRSSRFKSVSQPGDKTERALILSEWVKAGRVWICPGADGDYLIEEHSLFPDEGQHDDTVDANAVMSHYYGLRSLTEIIFQEIETLKHADTVESILSFVGGRL